ncbi:MAG: DUF11 domain-containing protein [Ruminococcus sp.]|nr:DUF11 domain-containing protein [Ruminococcus sp.]
MATTFTNTATLSYNGTSVQSNTAVGAIESVLSVSKNTALQTYRPGDTITYVVSIVNNSDTEVTGLTVTDDLGAYIFNTGTVQPLDFIENSAQYYSAGMLQAAPAVSTADGLVFSDIAVPANDSAQLIYQAQVNEFAPLDTGGMLANTVVVTGTGICDVTATEAITAATEAVLSVVKSVSPVPVTENGELTFTFQLQNTGNTAVTAADNAIVSDTFQPVLSDISVTLDGKTLEKGTGYTYDETTGVFRTADGVITIPAATVTQDAATGVWSVQPGVTTLIVTGTVGPACEITAP